MVKRGKNLSQNRQKHEIRAKKRKIFLSENQQVTKGVEKKLHFRAKKWGSKLYIYKEDLNIKS